MDYFLCFFIIFSFPTQLSSFIVSQKSSKIFRTFDTFLMDNSVSILNPCIDFAFKRVFRDKDVVAGFLNSILCFKDSDAIISVKFIDKDLPSTDPIGMDFTVDVLCETSTGNRILIEMQNDYRDDYTSKAYVEFCRLVSDWDAQTLVQVTDYERESMSASATSNETKEFWKDIKRAIVVVITNKKLPNNKFKELFPDQPVNEPDVINSYSMIHSNNNSVLGNFDGRVVIISLSNFDKPVSELSSPVDRWLYAFKDKRMMPGKSKMHLYKFIDNLDAAQGEDFALHRFYDILNKETVALTVDLKRLEMRNAYNEGELIRMKSEVKSEVTLEVGRRLKIAGFDNDFIMKVADLSLSEVESL